MRSPLISVTFGFFSVAGGCSSIGDFPSWARTFIDANIEIDSARSSTKRIDFIDPSLRDFECSPSDELTTEDTEKILRVENQFQFSNLALLPVLCGLNPAQACSRRGCALPAHSKL